MDCGGALRGGVVGSDGLGSGPCSGGDAAGSATFFPDDDRGEAAEEQGEDAGADDNARSVPSYPDLPAPWTVQYSADDDREYFWNPVTLESRWDPPARSAPDRPESPGVDVGRSAGGGDVVAMAEETESEVSGTEEAESELAGTEEAESEAAEAEDAEAEDAAASDAAAREPAEQQVAVDTAPEASMLEAAAAREAAPEADSREVSPETSMQDGADVGASASAEEPVVARKCGPQEAGDDAAAREAPAPEPEATPEPEPEEQLSASRAGAAEGGRAPVRVEASAREAARHDALREALPVAAIMQAIAAAGGDAEALVEAARAAASQMAATRDAATEGAAPQGPAASQARDRATRAAQRALAGQHVARLRAREDAPDAQEAPEAPEAPEAQAVPRLAPRGRAEAGGAQLSPHGRRRRRAAALAAQAAQAAPPSPSSSSSAESSDSAGPADTMALAQAPEQAECGVAEAPPRPRRSGAAVEAQPAPRGRAPSSAESSDSAGAANAPPPAPAPAPAPALALALAPAEGGAAEAARAPAVDRDDDWTATPGFLLRPKAEDLEPEDVDVGMQVQTPVSGEDDEDLRAAWAIAGNTPISDMYAELDAEERPRDRRRRRPALRPPAAGAPPTALAAPAAGAAGAAPAAGAPAGSAQDGAGRATAAAAPPPRREAAHAPGAPAEATARRLGRLAAPAQGAAPAAGAAAAAPAAAPAAAAPAPDGAAARPGGGLATPSAPAAPAVSARGPAAPTAMAAGGRAAAAGATVALAAPADVAAAASLAAGVAAAGAAGTRAAPPPANSAGAGAVGAAGQGRPSALAGAANALASAFAGGEGAPRVADPAADAAAAQGSGAAGADARRRPKPKAHCLILDVDHTLVHSVDMGDIEHQTEYGNLCAFDKMPHTELWNNHCIRLRPFAQRFIAKAGEMFQIAIFSKGKEGYVAKVRSMLDPDDQYITRVACVEDLDANGKKDFRKVTDLKAHNVIVLDDRIDWWPDEVRRIQALRYDYFAAAEVKKAIELATALPRDSDHYLPCVMRFLQAVLEKASTPPRRTLRSACDATFCQVLADVTICTWPRNEREESCAQGYGARVDDHITSNVHLVVVARGDVASVEQIKQAAPGMLAVSNDWLHFCFATYALQDPAPFRADDVAGQSGGNSVSFWDRHRQWFWTKDRKLRNPATPDPTVRDQLEHARRARAALPTC